MNKEELLKKSCEMCENYSADSICENMSDCPVYNLYLMSKKDDGIDRKIPKFVIQHFRETLRMCANYFNSFDKRTCLDRDIMEGIVFADKLLTGEEITGMERSERRFISGMKMNTGQEPYVMTADEVDCLDKWRNHTCHAFTEEDLFLGMVIPAVKDNELYMLHEITNAGRKWKLIGKVTDVI